MVVKRALFKDRTRRILACLHPNNVKDGQNDGPKERRNPKPQKVDISNFEYENFNPLVTSETGLNDGQDCDLEKVLKDLENLPSNSYPDIPKTAKNRKMCNVGLPPETIRFFRPWESVSAKLDIELDSADTAIDYQQNSEPIPYMEDDDEEPDLYDKDYVVKCFNDMEAKSAELHGIHNELEELARKKESRILQRIEQNLRDEGPLDDSPTETPEEKAQKILLEERLAEFKKRYELLDSPAEEGTFIDLVSNSDEIAMPLNNSKSVSLEKTDITGTAEHLDASVPDSGTKNSDETPAAQFLNDVLHNSGNESEIFKELELEKNENGLPVINLESFDLDKFLRDPDLEFLLLKDSEFIEAVSTLPGTDLENLDETDGSQRDSNTQTSSPLEVSATLKETCTETHFNSGDDSPPPSPILSKRVRRSNMCYYCNPQKPITNNFCRHLVYMHKEKDLVQKMMKFPLNSRERKQVANEIRDKGNFLFYNGENMHRPYRTSKDQSPKKEEYIWCKLCLRSLKRDIFYRHLDVCRKNSKNIIACEKCNEQVIERYLKKHLKTCKNNYEVTPPPKPHKVRPAKIQRRVLQDFSIMPNCLTEDENLTEVLPTLKSDELGMAAREDELIRAVASDYRKNHMEFKAIVLVTSKMRDLARLMLLMKKKNETIKCFEDCLQSKHTLLLLSCVQEVCGLNTKTGYVAVPSMHKRLLPFLKSAFRITLRKINLNPDLTYDSKKQLTYDYKISRDDVSDQWATIISTNSEKSRKRNRRNKPVLVPTQKDIKSSLAYLRVKEETLYVELTTVEVTPVNFEQMCKLLIGDSLIFNGRRPCEPTEAKLTEYLQHKEVQYEEDLDLVISEEELKANEKLVVFEVEGKGTSNVDIYLTKAMKKCIDLLITLRSVVGVAPENPLLFPRTASLRPYKPQTVMSELRTSFGLDLEIPAAMTGRGARRELATHSQIRNPNKEGFTELLSMHMKHKKSTHEENYRLPIKDLLMSKVGTDLIKRRLIKDKSEESQLDFDIQGASETVENGPDGNSEKKKEDEQDLANEKEMCQEKESTEQQDLSEKDEVSDEDIIPTKRKRNRKCQVIDSDCTDEETENLADILASYLPKKRKVKYECVSPNRQRIKAKKIPWTAEEERIVLTEFSWCFEINKNPGEEKCVALISKYSALRNRKWQQLNSFVDNTRKGKRPILKEFKHLLK